MEDSFEVSIRNSVICVQRKCAKSGGVSALLGFLFISFLNWSVLFTFTYRKLFFLLKIPESHLALNVYVLYIVQYILVYPQVL